MAKRLNIKQLGYIKDRAKGMPQVKAVLNNYPDTKSYKSASAQAGYLENKPEIQTAIQKALEKRSLTIDKVAEIIAEGLKATRIEADNTNRINETDIPDHNTRHKFLKTLIELQGLNAPDKKEVKFSGIMAMIDNDKVKEIRSRFS